MTMEDVYVVQTSNTGNGKPVGVYRRIERAREEADVHAAAIFGESTPNSTQTLDGTEMRIYLSSQGEIVGSYAIFHFTLDEEVDNSESPEPEIKPIRRISLHEDV